MAVGCIIAFLSLLATLEVDASWTVAGKICVDNCVGRPLQNYQSCKSCSEYVTCVGGKIVTTTCNDNTYWDDYYKKCALVSLTCQEEHPTSETKSWFNIFDQYINFLFTIGSSFDQGDSNDYVKSSIHDMKPDLPHRPQQPEVAAQTDFPRLPPQIKKPVKPRECLTTPEGRHYRGRVSVTKSGRKCQKWTVQRPHRHVNCFGEPASENHCRNSFNPSKPGCAEAKPWCYTTDPGKRWEVCDIPMCNDESHLTQTRSFGRNPFNFPYYAYLSRNQQPLPTPWRPPSIRHLPLVTPVHITPHPLTPRSDKIDTSECLLTSDGHDYHGRVNTTRSGLTCQRWSVHQPHSHAYCQGEGALENYCSNNFAGKTGCLENAPWCYTTDPTKRWEYCDIPTCTTGIPDKPRECLTTSNGRHYRGRVSETKSGLKCQQWTVQRPHRHVNCVGEAATENHCSNSFNPDCAEVKPWCYTTDPNKRWEVCDIPMCHDDDLVCNGYPGSRCTRTCRGKRDGDYQTCHSCTNYLSCIAGMMFDMRPCPNVLVWDDKVKSCLETSTTCKQCQQ